MEYKNEEIKAGLMVIVSVAILITIIILISGSLVCDGLRVILPAENDLLPK